MTTSWQIDICKYVDQLTKIVDLLILHSQSFVKGSYNQVQRVLILIFQMISQTILVLNIKTFSTMIFSLVFFYKSTTDCKI